MKDWTDEQLGALLADTFRDHEHLADPETARRLAGAPPPRGRRLVAVVAAAAAVVLVGAGTAYVVGHRGVPSTGAGPRFANGPVGPSAPATTVAENRRLVAAESARIVGLVPLPDGATRLAREPAGWPRDWGMSEGPSDGTLTRTSWWSVPLPLQDVLDHLATHAPAGMGHPAGEDRVTEEGEQIWTIDYSMPSRRPEAYTDPHLLVQVREVGGRTVVRADTFLGARAVRTPQEELPSQVTGVTIARVAGRGQGPGRNGGPLPTVRLSSPADARRSTGSSVPSTGSPPACIRPPCCPVRR